MSLSEIVCSAEISVKLRELGVKHKSMFSWFDTEKYGNVVEESHASFDLDNYISVQRIGAAYTVEEIFEMLPNIFYKDEIRQMDCLDHDTNICRPKELTIRHRYHLKLMPVAFLDRHWYCWAIGHGYDNFGIPVSEISFGEHDMTAAGAAAKMLIYLIENGLMNE